MQRREASALTQQGWREMKNQGRTRPRGVCVCVCVCVCVGVCSCICYIMSTKTLVLLAKRGRLGEVRTFELVLTTLKAYLRFKARF